MAARLAEALVIGSDKNIGKRINIHNAFAIFVT